MKTVTVNPKTIAQNWYLVDAKDVILGRLSSTVANRLMGKHKPVFSTSHDVGDHIVIINAEQIALTGNKRDTKKYFTHSTFPGGGRTLSFKETVAKDPGEPLRKAIEGMLPKNSRGWAMAKKLHIYGGEIHPHAAQKPQVLEIK